ncbi:MAG: hypothetical protein GY769_07785 [bacterium]|nr:hypothetical protein [bacterium]
MKWLLIAMYVAKMADLGTTEMALSRGGFEANPFMQNQGFRWAYGTVAPLAVYELGRRMKSRRARIITYVAATAGWSLIAYSNYRAYSRMRERAPGGGLRLQFSVGF